jgi:hypothetical protein
MKKIKKNSTLLYSLTPARKFKSTVAKKESRKKQLLFIYQQNQLIKKLFLNHIFSIGLLMSIRIKVILTSNYEERKGA